VDQEAALAARKGVEHEQRYLEQLREQHPTIVEMDPHAPETATRTLAAM
jgi:hypothetical protein